MQGGNELEKKIYILIENTFQDEETIYPYYRFKEEGYIVETVGPQKDAVYIGKSGLKLKADIEPYEVTLSSAAAIIIPGGGAPDKLRILPEFVEIVKKAFDSCLLIAAICHGPQLLIEADVVRGLKVTGYAGIATDLKNAGAEYIDRSVIVDANIITSRKPADLPDFCKSTIELLKVYKK